MSQAVDLHVHKLTQLVALRSQAVDLHKLTQLVALRYPFELMFKLFVNSSDQTTAHKLRPTFSQQMADLMPQLSVR